MKRTFLALTISLSIISCNNNTAPATDNTAPAAVVEAEPPALRFTVVNVYPHDTASFTQGLIINNGKLFEGTGGSPEYSTYKSWVGVVDMKTGKPLQKTPLDTKYFGEGITILGDKLYELTWKGNIGFVYDVKTLKKLQDFPLKTEGWGITNDGTNLIVSDGSSNLYFLNPATFATARIISVTDNNGPVGNLNELEYIKGSVYANKWGTDYIYKIDPSSGKVTGKADMTGLLNQYAKEFAMDDKVKSGDAVLNGIAYDSTNNKIYITGKLWPKLFEVKFE